MNEKILTQLQGRAEFYPQQLERQYPQILSKIMMMWDSPEFDSYLNKFMLDHRDKPRQGFPPDVASEILRLSKLHSELYGIPASHSWVDSTGIKID